MRGRLILLLLCACEPVATPTSTAPRPTPSAAPSASAGDACQADIPDCEAACAMREAHRTQHLEWFDRRCAAVVLGKNPDKVVPPSVAATPMPDAGADAAAKLLDCEVPFYYDATGLKKWKLECLD